MGEQPLEIQDESARWLSNLEILFETVRDLTSTLSTHEVIERLIDRTLVHLESEIASVLLMEADGSMRISHARGLPDEVMAQTRIHPGEGIAGHVVATGQPLLVPDVEQDPRFRRRNHERYYTHSCLSVPLVFQGRVRGVINVNNKRSQNPFDASDLRLLEIIAGHAAAETRAQRDALTNLANHGFFWSTIESEVKRAQRHERKLTLVMADVDHFKAYNDRLGHRQGDSALVAVARVIALNCRSHDHAARYGGEEFAVILPETSLDGAVVFAEKIRQGVESLDECGLTLSVGVASLDPSAGDASKLVEAADSQLYRAKSEGRNRICVAT
jgi:diguanylate cyclase (GGDEF)-like protein